MPRLFGVPNRHHLARSVLALMMASCVCDNTTAPQSVITTVLLSLAGNSQSAYLGATLTSPLEVKVQQNTCVNITNCTFAALAGVTVTWQVTSGGGTLSALTSTSDAAGIARITWTLGTNAGVGSVRAQLPNTSSLDAVEFTAAAVQHRTLLTLETGDNQVAPPSGLLPQPIVVRVTDTSLVGTRVGLSGISLNWSAFGTGAVITNSPSVTDAQGRSSVTWRLGSPLGVQSLRVTMNPLPLSDPASFLMVNLSATAQQAPTRVLRVVSGGNQFGVVGRAQWRPLVLEYVTVDPTTGAATPVPGAAVTLGVSAGIGSVAPTSATSDAQGRVSAQWTLGAALGAQSLSASTPVVPGFDAASVFVVNVTATAEPADIVLQDNFALGASWITSATTNEFGVWSYTRNIEPVGGNPGGFVRVMHTLNATTNPTFVTIFTRHLYLGGAYDPSVQGPIASLDYSEDTRSAAGSYAALVLTQNNVEYRAEFTGGTTNAGVWQTKTLSGITPAQFSPAPGPNFSLTGGPMQFGYRRGDTQRFQFFTATHDLDNWMVTIRR